MKVTELDTKEVQVTRTEKRYVLNEKVFQLDDCPDWAQYAAVDEDGEAYWYSSKPETVESSWIGDTYSPVVMVDGKANVFDPTDWQHSLIERSKKVLEVTMSDIEKQFGCKVKIVKEI